MHKTTISFQVFLRPFRESLNLQKKNNYRNPKLDWSLLELSLGDNHKVQVWNKKSNIKSSIFCRSVNLLHNQLSVSNQIAEM